MFYTPEQKGLTQQEVDQKVEELWAKETARGLHNCHDCAVKPGEEHIDGCDTARCSICKGQLLSCDCEDGESDIWTGMWPGIKECYEQKLICWDDSIAQQWCFDLNTWVEREMTKIL